MSLQNKMLEKVPWFQGIWLNPYPGAWGNDPIRYDLWTPFKKRHDGKVVKVFSSQKMG